MLEHPDYRTIEDLIRKIGSSQTVLGLEPELLWIAVDEYVQRHTLLDHGKPMYYGLLSVKVMYDTLRHEGLPRHK